MIYSQYHFRIYLVFIAGNTSIPGDHKHVTNRRVNAREHYIRDAIMMTTISEVIRHNFELQ